MPGTPASGRRHESGGGGGSSGPRATILPPNPMKIHDELMDIAEGSIKNAIGTNDEDKD